MSQTDPTSLELAKFYEIPEGLAHVEITEKVLKSPLVEEQQKQSIQKLNRKIFLFTYPSGSIKIKGLLSFSSTPSDRLLIFLRGGNRIFSITNPGSDWVCCEPYTVVTTTYRGGVSEGTDQFGGNDTDDVKNLIDHLPKLGETFRLKLALPTTLLGSSRGAMEMFLALARYPYLQERFEKVISLSGLLDIRNTLATRPDMVKMFKEEFGIGDVDEESWIKQRDPLLTASKIKKDLPIQIIQGSDDKVIDLAQGHRMVEQLQQHGCNVTYKEIKGGEHCLFNLKNRTHLVLGD